MRRAVVNANLWATPEAQDAGWWPTVVTLQLELLNEAHDCKGCIPPSLCTPAYLARLLRLDVAPHLTQSGEKIVRAAMLAAAKAGMIKLEPVGCILVGWTPRGGEGPSAARMRRHRAKLAGKSASRAPETSRDAETSPPARRRAPIGVDPEAWAGEAYKAIKAGKLPPTELAATAVPAKGRKLPDQAVTLAHLLLGYVASREPQGRIGRLDDEARDAKALQWAEAIRLMRDRDRLDYAVIEGLIHWSQKHKFWKTVVISAAVLRDKASEMQKARTPVKTPR